MMTEDKKKAIQAGMYFSALSIIGDASVPIDNENQYLQLLPNARFYLKGLPIELPSSFVAFSKQQNWQERTIGIMHKRGLNNHLAFGMALQFGQIYPEQTQLQIIESGEKIGISTRPLQLLLKSLATADIAERGEIIDDFLESLSPSSPTGDPSTSSTQSHQDQQTIDVYRTPPAIFVSYARPDVRPAEAVVTLLKAAGFPTWFDKNNLLGGQDWQLEIRKAIATADLFMLCLSTNSVGRVGFYQGEMTYALQQAELRPQGKVYIMPVRLNHCPIPDRIARWQVVDIFEEDGATKLFRSIMSALNVGARVPIDIIEELNNALRDFNKTTGGREGRSLKVVSIQEGAKGHTESMLFTPKK